MSSHAFFPTHAKDAAIEVLCDQSRLAFQSILLDYPPQTPYGHIQITLPASKAPPPIGSRLSLIYQGACLFEGSLTSTQETYSADPPKGSQTLEGHSLAYCLRTTPVYAQFPKHTPIGVVVKVVCELLKVPLEILSSQALDMDFALDAPLHQVMQRALLDKAPITTENLLESWDASVGLSTSLSLERTPPLSAIQSIVQALGHALLPSPSGGLSLVSSASPGASQALEFPMATHYERQTHAALSDQSDESLLWQVDRLFAMANTAPGVAKESPSSAQLAKLALHHFGQSSSAACSLSAKTPAWPKKWPIGSYFRLSKSPFKGLFFCQGLRLQASATQGMSARWWLK